jgi:adenine-specific DNA-methyltransferase
VPKSRLTPRARDLRHDCTDAERLLWWALRNRQLGGWKWRRQSPRGSYILDFLCAEAGLVVELDGGQHAAQAPYDERRTAWLEAQGLKVLRFWNAEVIADLAAVCDAVLAACPSPSRRSAPGPSLSPLPRGEGLHVEPLAPERGRGRDPRPKGVGG